MIVSLGLLADYANVSREGKLNVMGVFNRVTASTFPALHSEMQLVFRIEFEPLEPHQQLDIEIVLTDPDGGDVMRLSGHVAIPDDLPPNSSFDQIVKLTNTALPVAGPYRFTIYVNGDEKHRIPFDVVQLPLPGSA